MSAKTPLMRCPSWFLPHLTDYQHVGVYRGLIVSCNQSLRLTPYKQLLHGFVNRFYQLLRLDYISTASQRIKSCLTTFDQINLPQLLIKPLELNCGASGSVKLSSMGI